MRREYRIRRGRIPSGKPRGEAVEMTARALRAGMLTLEADDGAVRLCPRGKSCGALWGDRVLAQPLGGDGAVVRRVLSRANETMLGVLGVGRRHASFDPFERRLPRWIRVEGSAQDFEAGGLAQDGDIVRVRVVRWENEGGLLVRVEERVGSMSSARAALDALVLSEGLSASFSPDALAQAEGCKPADLEDDPAREDLRGLCLFTIDGRDAKDFDDAVSLEPLPDGGALLGVHIADVGSYVPQGTPMDREAYARGTSVYFPGRVLPMLPEPVSNGVCSLRPGEDKFALSALMEISPRGETKSLRLARTIIRSAARLVYDDVNAMLAGDGEQTARMEALGVREPLVRMCALARRMRERRWARGGLDFELDEPVFELDEQGEPVSMAVRARGEAERMIEDFMLAANEAVARFARGRGLPLLYRVHEQPDPQKLEELAGFLDSLGVPTKGLRGRAAPGDVRAALEYAKALPEYPAVATLALRSMRKARYDAKPLGHYGLALSDYCHFTSPIRRYPDLVVSRALTAALTGAPVALTGDALSAAALRSSDMEREAADAERLADRLMAARYMASHAGEAFDGRVSGLNEGACYVALGNGAEGVLYASALGERFALDGRHTAMTGERTGLSLSLGQAVRVRVESVELANGTIRLSLCDAPKRAIRGHAGNRRKRHGRKGK